MLRALLRAALLSSALLSSALPIALGGAHLLFAQSSPRGEPGRPKLGAGADTNDALAYFTYGASKLERRPDEAAAAFYWASRLDPGFPEALYARRVALLLANPRRLVSYVNGVRSAVESREMLHADSLYARALRINPLLYRNFDRLVVTQYLLESVEHEARRWDPGENFNRNELQYWIDVLLDRASPAIRGWMAYSQGDFQAALRFYAEALKRAREKAELRADRARAFHLAGQHDSALAEFERATAELRASDEKKVAAYESKALLEHSRGLILEQLGRDSAAREAYGRALQEDLAYYPAHARLALLALRLGDTATALNELDLAVQLEQNDAALHYDYGYALATARGGAAAEPHLRKAIALEPYYAAPHAMLARMYDAAELTDEAVTHYRAFAARASRRDPLLPSVLQRLQALAPAVAGAAPDSGRR